MDDTDRNLLNMLQREFPIEERPFAALADRLGIGGEEVLSRIEKLRGEGLIRRLGASLNPRKLGYTSTLAGARVKPENVDAAAEYINRFPEITHNYERNDEFNMWFTVIAKDEAEVEAVLNDIRANAGVEELIDLPATRIFKINVKFEL
ncbi:MAG: AsnC family transcriptional regulator [bacterium]